jgi:hypothetical protein
MKKILKIIHNPTFQSFVHTLFTDLLYDASVAAAFGVILFDGNLSKEALYVLGYSVFRTLLRSVRTWTMSKFPKP